MPTGASLLVGGPTAVAGAVAGSQKDEVTSGLRLGPQSGLESSAYGTSNEAFGSLKDLLNNSFNEQDVANGRNAQVGLADLLKQYSQSGGLPTSADINTSNDLFSQLFAPQRTALDQSFTKEQQRTAQLSAALGRPVNDPILQAKLSQGYQNNLAQLNSQQGAAATQFAMNLPGQRLNYATQGANVLSNLATQAFQNRSALLGMGNDMLNQERNWRLQTAQKYQESGGGLKGAISGGMAGMASGLSMASSLGSMGAFGGGMGAAPAAAPMMSSAPTYSVAPTSLYGGNWANSFQAPTGLFGGF